MNPLGCFFQLGKLRDQITGDNSTIFRIKNRRTIGKTKRNETILD